MRTLHKRGAIAALLAGALSLSACVTVPQNDLTEAVKAAIQPAVDTFFEALEEEQERAQIRPEMTESGESRLSPLSFGEHTFTYYHLHRPWNEQEARRGCSDRGTLTIDACMSQIAAFHENWSAASHFDGWGFWATIEEESLFKVGIHRTPEDPGPCLDTSDCLPGGYLYTHYEGTKTGKNPVSGSAVWTGHTRAVVADFAPIEGRALLQADLVAGTLNVYFTDMAPFNYEWTGVRMRKGNFSHQAHTGVSSISGAFYGDEYEGAAGRFFLMEEHVIGVFGALREPE